MHDFRNFDVGIETMALEYVDIIQVESSEGSLDGIEDVFAGQAMPIDVAQVVGVEARDNITEGHCTILHGAVKELRHNDEGLARCTDDFYRSAEDNFRLSH